MSAFELPVRLTRSKTILSEKSGKTCKLGAEAAERSNGRAQNVLYGIALRARKCGRQNGRLTWDQAIAPGYFSQCLVLASPETWIRMPLCLAPAVNWQAGRCAQTTTEQVNPVPPSRWKVQSPRLGGCWQKRLRDWISRSTTQGPRESRPGATAGRSSFRVDCREISAN